METWEKQKQGIWRGFVRVSIVSARALPCPFSCPHASRVKLRLTRISTGLGERRCPGKAPVMPYSFLSPQPPYDTKKPLRWEEREQPKSKQLKRNLKNSGLTGTLR